MGFPRQEYSSGVPFPSPGELPDPGIKPLAPALAGGLFTTEPPGKSYYIYICVYIYKHIKTLYVLYMCVYTYKHMKTYVLYMCVYI